MSARDTIAELIERVEKATGPSLELDALVEAYLHGGRAAHTFTEDTPGARLRRSYGPDTVFSHADPEHNGGHVLTRHVRKAPPVSFSLDSVVALVEKQLPGWMFTLLVHQGFSKAVANLRDKSILDPEKREYHGYHNSPACALLLAFLKATQHQEKKP
jgi:hypothetical protein